MTVRTDLTHLRLILLLAAVLLAGGLSACDNTIDPILDDSGEPFAMHGYLDMAADTQFVRVEALRTSILGDRIPLDDVQVTSTDETTGEVVVWHDSTVTLDDGSAGTLYYGVFRPRAARTYRLDIRRSGRAGGSARTTLPPAPDFNVLEMMGNLQPVQFTDLVNPPDRIQILYTVGIPESGEERTIAVNYGNVGANPSSARLFDVRLLADQNIVLSTLGRTQEDRPLILREVAAAVRIPSHEWENPREASNLDNLTGFFASVGYHEFAWRLDPQILDAIGYVNGQMP